MYSSGLPLKGLVYLTHKQAPSLANLSWTFPYPLTLFFLLMDLYNSQYIINILISIYIVEHISTSLVYKLHKDPCFLVHPIPTRMPHRSCLINIR